MDIIKQFKTATELFLWLIKPKNSNKYYYRGISRFDQQFPSIMRTHGKDLSYVENAILRDFIRYGGSLVGNITNAFDCVAYAQHFGLPTRLVDWTRNPLVALFFAIYYANDSSNPQILLLPRENSMPIFEPVHKVTHAEMGISYRNPIRDYTKFIKQVNEGFFSELCIDSFKYLDDAGNIEAYCTKVKENDSKGFMIMVDPGYSNPRILAQDGLFYFPRQLTKETIVDEYEASSVKAINIEPTWRLSLLSMLESSGISKYKLFFDLPTICSYIVEQAEDADDQFEIGLNM